MVRSFVRVGLPIIVGTIAAALFIIACLTPWFGVHVTWVVTGVTCDTTNYRYWKSTTTVCNHAIDQTICGCNAITDNTNCGNQCHVQDWFLYTESVVGVATSCLGLSVLLFIFDKIADIEFIGKIELPVITGFLGVAAGIVALVMFVFLPDRFRADGYCPRISPNLCTNFVGSFTGGWEGIVSAKVNWGPSTGWILDTVGTALALLYVGLLLSNRSHGYTRIQT